MLGIEIMTQARVNGRIFDHSVFLITDVPAAPGSQPFAGKHDRNLGGGGVSYLTKHYISCIGLNLWLELVQFSYH